MNKKDEFFKKDKIQVVKLDKAFKLVIIHLFDFHIFEVDCHVHGLVLSPDFISSNEF